MSQIVASHVVDGGNDEDIITVSGIAEMTLLTQLMVVQLLTVLPGALAKKS